MAWHLWRNLGLEPRVPGLELRVRAASGYDGNMGNPTGKWIRDIDAATFEADVLERSQQVPVVVDFWAPWCGPCKVLGPLLEKEIENLGGKVELVKIDTEKNAQFAAQVGIQGIPAVKAFFKGQLVAEFTGAQTVPYLKQWLGALAPPEEVLALEAGAVAVETGRLDMAETHLVPLLDKPKYADDAALELARGYVAARDGDKANAMLGRISPKSPAYNEVENLKTRLAFAADAAETAAADGGDVDSLAAKVESNPDDVEARFHLATAEAARDNHEAALEQFLEIVRRDRAFKDDIGRRSMLAIFDQLGAQDPRVRTFRRKLQILI